MNTLQVTTPSDREIVMTRVFDAPRQMVFDAHTKPELVKRWLFGPDHWSLDECVIDLRPGGAYRYVWLNAKSGERMGMGGMYREVVAPERIVATEKFDEAWYPGECVGTTVLTETAGRTTLTLSLLYESLEARDIALKSGMDQGMVLGYDRLERILTTSAPAQA